MRCAELRRRPPCSSHEVTNRAPTRASSSCGRRLVRSREPIVCSKREGMAATLRVASERRAYTLTDRATFTQLAHALTLQALFEHHLDLLNTYAVVIPDGGMREDDAMRFMRWISDGDGRARIAAFT